MNEDRDIDELAKMGAVYYALKHIIDRRMIKLNFKINLYFIITLFVMYVLAHAVVRALAH